MIFDKIPYLIVFKLKKKKSNEKKLYFLTKFKNIKYLLKFDDILIEIKDVTLDSLDHVAYLYFLNKLYYLTHLHDRS